MTMPDGSSFEAELWSDGSRACPCLQRGCVRKCCPAGLVSNYAGDCVRVSPSNSSHDQSESQSELFVNYLARLKSLALNMLSGNLSMPVDTSEEPPPFPSESIGLGKPLENITTDIFKNLSNAVTGDFATGPPLSGDEKTLFSMTDDERLSLLEAITNLSTKMWKNFPTPESAIADELITVFGNISSELYKILPEVADFGTDKSRRSGDIDKLLSMVADKTQAPVRDMFVLYGTACPCNRYTYDDENDTVLMLGNGTLVFSSFMVPAGDYCFDETESGELTLSLCFPADQCPQDERESLYFYPAGTALSLPFLAATFVVYALFKELRNRVGAAVMCYVATLFVAYALLTAVQISMGYVTIAFCLTAAFIIYFSFLASFFWLNVMCFDIFWTFSGFRSLRGTAREREHKKFIIYSIYSWGCPLIMLSVTLIMQFHEDIPKGLLRPQFGESRCWFPDDKITTLAYFYGPVGALVLCNIILFILTAIRIAQLKRETAMLKGTDSRRHDDDNRQRFNLYLKLFLVMGVNWSMEVISWLAGGPEYVWYATDICNTLQGVLIFVIFVWKDRIRRMLMEKFCPKRASSKLSKSTVVTYSTRASPSRLSHGMLNNKVTDNGNGDAVKITAITHLSDDSDVP